MALAHVRVLIHEFLNKDTDIVPEEVPLIILDSEFAVCMANNGKDTKHKIHIARRVIFVSNGEQCLFIEYFLQRNQSCAFYIVHH